MQPLPVLARALAGVAVLVCVSACGTVGVRVPVMRPAEINMAPYQNVAIGGVSGRGDRAVAGALEQALVDSQRFQVVDRTRMDAILRELQLSSSDLVDQQQAAKLGRLITAGAIIYGDVDSSYREQPTEERTKDDKGNVKITKKLRGDLSLRANFKIIDVSTGRLLIAKTYEESRQDTNTAYDGKQPAPIDRDSLERSARGAVIERFMKAIVPHKEYVTAYFRKDSDLPQLEGGIGWAQRGEWSKAQQAFNEAIGAAEKSPKIKTPTLAKAYFNLGLSYEYAGDYEKAIKMIEKAYQLTNDQDMLNEVDNIKRLEADAKKLAEQTGTAAEG